MILNVQTRSETTGLIYFKSIGDAFKRAEMDKTIWKISFPDLIDGAERVRLVRTSGNEWVFIPLPEYLKEDLDSEK